MVHQWYKQSDHLSGKPGNVREIYICQENVIVRGLSESRETVRKKNLVMKNCSNKVTTCLESLEMSGNYTYIRNRVVYPPWTHYSSPPPHFLQCLTPHHRCQLKPLSYQA